MELLKGTDSICPNPSEVLLSLVKENDIDGLRNLIKTYGKDLLLKRYGAPYTKCILNIACKDFAQTIQPQTINVLIQLGAEIDCNEETWDKKKLIHFAALGLNVEILKHVISLQSVNINAITGNGSTALHTLVREVNENAENVLECAKVLIENGIDVDKLDNANNRPLYWAAKKKHMEVVQMLLKQDERCTKKEANIIEKLNLNLSYNIVNDDEFRKIPSVALRALLFDRKEDEFIELLPLEIIKEEANEESYLEIACRKNLLKVVSHLLDNGFPNRSEQLNNALCRTASDGHYKIFKLLLDRSDKIEGELVNEILQKIDYDEYEDINYKKCFDLLLDKRNDGQIDVNFCDRSGNYALHYGPKYGGPEIAAKLLQLNASLANRNQHGILTIADIDYDTLKEHFDSCIEAQPSNKLDKENMTITFDYETLLPTKSMKVAKCDDEEALTGGKVIEMLPECDVVYFLSESSDLKGLLKHPLITSFLYMKWYKMRWIFYTNLTFYLFFCLSLLLYSLTYFNLKEDDRHSISYLFVVFLFIATFIFILRELFQLIIAPRKYLSNFENYIEVVLLIIVCLMLFEQHWNDKERRQLCAIAFLLAAFEFLFLIGNYPDLSTNIVMLRTVSLNFFKLLLFYLILIVAFAFCFYTLFNENLDKHRLTEGDEEEKKFFINPLLSMFKTIIMLTGEFEAGDIDFDQYPVISHLIFLSFVVTIAVILLNLLNGLAVSDTQEIKNEAELVGHIARAQFIADAEALIIGNFKQTKLAQTYYNYFSCVLNRNSNCLRNDWLSRKICIYPNLLKGFKLTVFINRQGQVLTDEGYSGCCCFKHIHLDKKIMKSAQHVITAKREKLKELTLENIKHEINELKMLLLNK